MISLFMFLLLRERWSFGNTEADQTLLQQLPVGIETHAALPDNCLPFSFLVLFYWTWSPSKISLSHSGDPSCSSRSMFPSSKGAGSSPVSKYILLLELTFISKVPSTHKSTVHHRCSFSSSQHQLKVGGLFWWFSLHYHNSQEMVL